MNLKACICTVLYLIKIAGQQCLSVIVNELSFNEPRHEKTSILHRRKQKAQISFAVTAKLISAFVFATRMVQFLYFLWQNPQPLAIFCACNARFVSDLFGNHVVSFPIDAAQMVSSGTMRIEDTIWTNNNNNGI